MVADGGVAAVSGDQVAGGGRHRFGQLDGDGPEADRYGVAIGVDVVVEGESDDSCGALGVEQEQQPGDAVVGIQSDVMQQPLA